MGAWAQTTSNQSRRIPSGPRHRSPDGANPLKTRGAQCSLHTPIRQMSPLGEQGTSTAVHLGREFIRCNERIAKRASKTPTKVAKKVPTNDEERDATMKRSDSKKREGGDSPSQLIDARIKELGDWRGEMLARVRALIREADPDVVEEVKWRKPSNSMLGVPVWEHDGIICTGETYKAVVKLTFAKGASLKDPSGLFNSSLEGNVRRAIDFHEGDRIDEKALQALIRAAVALNTSARSGARPVRSQKRPKTA